jgi:hypothetical protein
MTTPQRVQLRRTKELAQNPTAQSQPPAHTSGATHSLSVRPACLMQRQRCGCTANGYPGHRCYLRSLIYRAMTSCASAPETSHATPMCYSSWPTHDHRNRTVPAALSGPLALPGDEPVL